MARRKTKSRQLILYIIAIVGIVALVVWLSGGRSFNGMMIGNHTFILSGWNWVHILISIAIGFVLGIAFSKRK
ncbi:MAG: hypothetical protein HQ521_06265 [Bacteroidetes bacterium]|nr:hypothetical protein [Bacteroidota bacterium]